MLIQIATNPSEVTDMASPITNMTPEERQEVLDKAQVARRERREAAIRHAEENLCTVYEDEPAWRDMASNLGVRLPSWYDEPSPRNIKRFLKKINKDVNWFKEMNGVSKLDQWGKMNPRWTMLACAGIMLEDMQEEIR